MKIRREIWNYIHFEPMSGCWLWSGGCGGNGYGYFSSGGKSIRAHRAVYELLVGIIGKGLCLCHKCDNRLCVNPEHMFVGTHSDNMRDMAQKKRAKPPKGESASWSKLTEKQVREIRHWASMGVTHQILSEDYGVDRSHISRMCSGKNWSHLK